MVTSALPLNSARSHWGGRPRRPGNAVARTRIASALPGLVLIVALSEPGGDGQGRWRPGRTWEFRRGARGRAGWPTNPRDLVASLSSMPVSRSAIMLSPDESAENNMVNATIDPVKKPSDTRCIPASELLGVSRAGRRSDRTGPARRSVEAARTSSRSGRGARFESGYSSMSVRATAMNPGPRSD